MSFGGGGFGRFRYGFGGGIFGYCRFGFGRFFGRFFRIGIFCGVFGSVFEVFELFLDAMGGVVDEVSCFGCFCGDVLQVRFGEVMDMVLQFLRCRADFVGDGDECFEEVGKLFRREDDERDGAEDDEFLPADV